MLFSVLSIEDSTFLPELIALLLKRQDGFELEAAKTLKEGLERLKERRYDGILLDLNLPDSLGLNTLKEIRNRTKIPVVVLAGDDDEDLKRQCIAMGARKYLVKGNATGPDIASALIDCAAERSPSLIFTGRATLAKRQIRGDLRTAEIATYIAGGFALVIIAMFIIGFSVDMFLQLKTISVSGGQYNFPNWALIVVTPALGLMVHFIFAKSKGES